MTKHLTTVCIIAMACIANADDRPNILWITCEDISPNLGRMIQYVPAGMDGS